MRTDTWLKTHTHSLAGRRVAVTGPTGGLGAVLCADLAALGAQLILLGRNPGAMAALRRQLEQEHPGCVLREIPVDLEDIGQVRAACDQLEDEPPDILFLAAGAYSIPRHRCSTGFDNVFQINYVSHEYMLRRLAPVMVSRPGARVVAVGSIAHRYAATDPEDVDFSTRRAASKVYGNSKRYLMASCWEYFAQPEVRRQGVTLAVVHPGITYTNITAHYPPWLFTLIKHPMQWIFMSRRRACLSLLQGAFEETGYGEWIGPRWFDVWGLPVKRRVRSLPPEECRRIAATAAAITDRLIDAESTYDPPHS